MEKFSKYVAKALKGDTKAFDKLYELTRRSVYFTALSFVKKQEDAEDIMQEVYILAFSKLDTLGDPAKFGAWVNRIAVNSSKSFLAKKGVHPEDSLDEEGFDEPVDENFLLDEYIDKLEKRKIVTDIMKSCLSETLYQTVIMFYFNDMSISEIAENMSCPEGTVKYRLNTARAKIKKEVENYEKDNNDKLYGLAGLPFLARLLAEEARSVNVPALDISALISHGSFSKTTLKPQKGFKGKIAVFSAAAAVVIGGTAAVVIATDNNAGLPESGTISDDTQPVRISESESTSVIGASESEDEEFSGIWKTEDNADGTADIVKYNGTDSEVDIPAVIDGKTIVSVTGFSENKYIKSVKIPKGIKELDIFAFSQCENLSDVEIPDSVTEINGYAFASCKGLAQINIPKSVKLIGSSAFESCTGLTSVTVPDGVEEIEGLAFDGCSNLSSIRLPDSLSVIREYSFYECSSLKSISFPKKITEISKGVLSRCENLETVTIPNGVTLIDERAFNGCSKLGKVSIPDGVKEIGYGAFSDCVGLAEINIPDSVTKIGSHAFSGCTGLTEVNIPDSVAEIGSDAFEYCENIQVKYKGKTYNYEQVDKLCTEDGIQLVPFS